jgi:uncharacterized protein YjlB
MVEVKTYAIPPTRLIPNSPYKLLHYPGLLLKETDSPSAITETVFDRFAQNGWQCQWIARYGSTQTSHYHSGAHECMAVISGEGAAIRFGVADTTEDLEESTRGSGFEDGGVTVQACRGDVFVVPAGVAHKTHFPKPELPEGEGLIFYNPEKAHELSEEEAKRILTDVKIEGYFMMMGAYPVGSAWDFAVGGDHEGRYGDVWNVPKPERDPVLGDSEEGLKGLWKEGEKLDVAGKVKL